MLILYSALFLIFYVKCFSATIYVAELFSMKIEPTMFNWTTQGLTEQFHYRPALEGKPDLPSWMRYMYSSEYHTGYLYGTPPENLADREIHIEIVALNRQNYETRKIILPLQIHAKHPALNSVQMKIDNLNWIHLMDPGRIENLKNIYRKDLWPECTDDIHIIFMESAIMMGARLPLRPQQREGVIVHLGSNAPFSKRLLELQEEVKPLYKISSCTYKRTSVQTTFENVGFKLDWCAFRIVGDDTLLHHPNSIKNVHGSELSTFHNSDRWEGFSRSDVPERNYIDELTFSIAIPGMIMTILVAILTAIFCLYHDSMGKYQQSVQMVQYSNSTNQPTTTLKNLKEAPNYFVDDMSLQSHSPSNSLYRETSPKGNNYMRPKPPPYKSTGLGVPVAHKNGVDI